MATKLYTFTGESSIEALKKAQAECGEKAILVTTKQIRPKTINKKPLYEILVSVEEDEIEKPNLKQVNLRGYDKLRSQTPKFEITEEPSANSFVPDDELFMSKKNDENILVNISKAAKEISEITKVTANEKGANEGQNLGYNKKIDDVAKRMSALDDKVNLMMDMLWQERAPSRNSLAIPPEFASIYKAAKKSGMKEEHLQAIMQTTIENMPTSMKSNPNAVKRYFYSLLRKMLPCRNEQDGRKRRIMMLVGPTGVGKTTTLAKLAARFAYSGEKRYKTGIITLDTYRIGAVEQLFQYAKMMKLPILDVIEIDDFKNALAQLKHCDVILIDTTGNSQYDKEKLARLDKFLKSADVQIDVNLVMSAGSKVEDLLEIYNGFSFLDIDTLIITKIDETKFFGNVFSLIYETNTPVSYFCVGQEVPDDLLEARGEFLVECVLNGYNEGDKDE